MGSILSSCTEMVMIGSYDMPGVSSNTAWETFSDIEGGPSFHPYLLSVELLRRPDDPSCSKVGSSWKERRIFTGKEIVMRKTVTRMVEDPEQGTFSARMVINLDGISWNFPDAVETCTFSIEPVEGDSKWRESCRISWSMAYIAAGFCGKFLLAFIKPCLLKSLNAQVEKEMQFYYEEALRRTTQQHITTRGGKEEATSEESSSLERDDDDH